MKNGSSCPHGCYGSANTTSLVRAFLSFNFYKTLERFANRIKHLHLASSVYHPLFKTFLPNNNLKSFIFWKIKGAQWHGVKMGPGPQHPRRPSKFKMGPGTPLKFKSGTPGPPSKFKSGTLIIIFLHCLTYFVLDKYIYNMEIIFHE